MDVWQMGLSDAWHKDDEWLHLKEVILDGEIYFTLTFVHVIVFPTVWDAECDKLSIQTLESRQTLHFFPFF